MNSAQNELVALFSRETCIAHAIQIAFVCRKDVNNMRANFMGFRFYFGGKSRLFRSFFSHKFLLDALQRNNANNTNTHTHIRICTYCFVFVCYNFVSESGRRICIYKCGYQLSSFVPLSFECVTHKHTFIHSNRLAREQLLFKSVSFVALNHIIHGTNCATL